MFKNKKYNHALRELDLLEKWVIFDFPTSFHSLCSLLTSFIKTVIILSNSNNAVVVTKTNDFMQYIYNQLFTYDCGEVQKCNDVIQKTVMNHYQFIVENITSNRDIGMEILKDLFLICHSSNFCGSARGILDWIEKIIGEIYGGQYFENELNSEHPRLWDVIDGKLILR